MKKKLALLLSIAMVLAMLPMATMAQVSGAVLTNVGLGIAPANSTTPPALESGIQLGLFLVLPATDTVGTVARTAAPGQTWGITASMYDYGQPVAGWPSITISGHVTGDHLDHYEYLVLAATQTNRTIVLTATYVLFEGTADERTLTGTATLSVVAQPAGGGVGDGGGGGAAAPTPTPTPDADEEDDEDDAPVVEEDNFVIVEAEDGELVADGDELGELADAGLDLIVVGEYELVVLPPAVLYELAWLADGDDVVITLDSVLLDGAYYLVVENGVIELAAVTFEITAGDVELSDLAAYATVVVYLGYDVVEDLLEEGLNIARIIAVLEDGTLIGGVLDVETGEFVFETALLGSFTIQYVEDLTRVILQVGSGVAFCVAGNAPTQFMDVPPQVTADGRTVLPLRAMGYLLGAEVYWDAYTDGVTLTQNGQAFSFIIGEEDSQRIEGRTMVPVRSIAEFFGATVNWDPATGDVEILKIN